jgi:hypothetical protein
MMDFIASGVPAPVAAATRMRLIEFEIPGSAIDLKGKASKYDRFYDLCGLAGRRWIEYVLQPDVLVDFVAHMERVSLGSFKTDGRFIAKLLHLLRWVVPHAHHDKAAIINFPAKFLAEFEETQKQAMLDADRQRLLTPGQQAILAYITKYRDKSLTYKVIPNGKVPQGQRLPSDPSCWAYQQGTVMVIEVESPKCTLIPEQNLKDFYSLTIRDRNYSSEMAKLLKDKSCTKSANVQILGLKDPAKTPHCYVFPEKVLEGWQDLASRIVGDFPYEDEQQ